MKKFLSLMMALLLCLCALAPAMAEDAAPAEDPAEAVPAVALPIAIDAFKAAYEAILTLNAPDCTLTWNSQEQNGQTIWMASINDSFVGLMLLADGENVAEIACLMQGELNENNLLTFLSMGGYGGAALLHNAGMEASGATETFMNTLFATFTQMTQGDQPDDICGLPGAMSISKLDENLYQYYFILKLTAAQ